MSPRLAPVPFPADATMWRIEDEKGTRLSAYSPQGAEVFDWPVSQFTVEAIQRRWGGGHFVVFFSNKQGQGRGRRRIGVAGPPKTHADVPEAEVVDDDAPPRGAELARTNPMTEALQLLGALDSLATNKANAAIAIQSQFLIKSQENASSMFAAAMGRETQMAKIQGAAVNPELDERLTRIERALTQILSEEDDPDDDPDEDDEAGEGGPQFPDEWDSTGQMVYRVLARQLPHLEKLLPDLVQNLIAKLQKEAAAKAAANGIPVPGGAVVEVAP